jgi:[ribosomal protein S18]-alanine N-acetyltransferase
MLDVSKIRLALPRDAVGIAEMSRDFIEQGLGWQWTPSRVLWSIRDKSTNVVVAREHGGLLGFGIMQYGDDSAHLALLGVQPAQRRHGLGALMVSWLEKCALVAGIETIRVEARSDKPQAVSFYLKHDYRHVGTTTGYYRGTIDAVRFEKKLRSSPPG